MGSGRCLSGLLPLSLRREAWKQPRPAALRGDAGRWVETGAPRERAPGRRSKSAGGLSPPRRERAVPPRRGPAAGSAVGARAPGAQGPCRAPARGVSTQRKRRSDTGRRAGERRRGNATHPGRTGLAEGTTSPGAHPWFAPERTPAQWDSGYVLSSRNPRNGFIIPWDRFDARTLFGLRNGL